MPQNFLQSTFYLAHYFKQVYAKCLKVTETQTIFYIWCRTDLCRNSEVVFAFRFSSKEKKYF